MKRGSFSIQRHSSHYGHGHGRSTTAGIPFVRRSGAYQQQHRRKETSESIVAQQNPINVKPTKRQRLKVKQQPGPSGTSADPTITPAKRPVLPSVVSLSFANCNNNVEAIHAAKMAAFEDQQRRLPARKELESTMEAKLLSAPTDEDREALAAELAEFRAATERIERKEDMTQYLLKTMHILDDYQKILKEETELAEKEPVNPATSSPVGGILLAQLGAVKAAATPPPQDIWRTQIQSTRDRKQRVIADYFAVVGIDPNVKTIPVASMGAAAHAARRQRFNQEEGKGIRRRSNLMRKHAYLPLCDGCGSDANRITDGFLTCGECGLSKSYFCGDAVSYKELQSYDFTRRFDYERPNHFSERLAQSQCKENIEIPETVMDLILLELRKERINDASKVTRVMMKAILKKTKLSKYYEHIPLIISKLSGVAPLKFEPELEEQLLVMFKEIQGPFEKHKPPGRRNCLSYPYILYKFCELLERDEFLPSFPLLKSREKLYKTDQIWKKICEELDWQYIPTV